MPKSRFEQGGAGTCQDLFYNLDFIALWDKPSPIADSDIMLVIIHLPVAFLAVYHWRTTK